jgi:Sulfotransferase domain
MREPNFFLVGAPRCGTTALFSMLGAHPDVCVSRVKEPDFFAADVVAAVPQLAGRAVTEWSRYLDLFRHAGAARAVGEGSVSYLSSRSAPGAIASRCPQARILMVLRDPAARLFSHYTAARAARVTAAPFLVWLGGHVDAGNTLVGPVEPGRYATHLTRYRRHFSEAQIHVVWYEDYVQDPAATLRGIFQVLDVDPTTPVAVTRRLNETRVPRWPFWQSVFSMPTPLRMAVDERAAAIRLYEAEIQALASLTGHNLDRWLDASGSPAR